MVYFNSKKLFINKTKFDSMSANNKKFDVNVYVYVCKLKIVEVSKVEIIIIDEWATIGGRTFVRERTFILDSDTEVLVANYHKGATSEDPISFSLASKTSNISSSAETKILDFDADWKNEPNGSTTVVRNVNRVNNSGTANPIIFDMAHGEHQVHFSIDGDNIKTAILEPNGSVS